MAKSIKILILLLLGLLVFSCEKKESPKSPTKFRELPDQELTQAVMIFNNKGVKSTEIQADYVAKYENHDLTKAKKIKADFFDEKGVHTSFLVADSAIIQERRQKLQALGNVVVITDEGIKLETESLRWDPQTEKIITEEFVKITKKDDTITGYGLETDQSLKNFKIKKKVKGKFKELLEEK